MKSGTNDEQLVSDLFCCVTPLPRAFAALARSTVTLWTHGAVSRKFTIEGPEFTNLADATLDAQTDAF